MAIDGPNSYTAVLDEAWQQHLAPREADAPTVISLFAGCGGSSLGYSMAGYREVLAVERDPMACATFRLNFPDVPLYAGNIEDLTAEACLAQSGMEPGQLDVLDGSPPCQGFSTAGKRRMADARNQLFHEYVRLLEVLQPKALIMENVSGMVKGKMKLVFAEIMHALKHAGYHVRTWMLNAKYFHVPQDRARMIFFGQRRDLVNTLRSPSSMLRLFFLRDALLNVCNTSQDIDAACYPASSIFYQLLREMGSWEGGHLYHPRGALFGLRRLHWSRPSRTILREDGMGGACQCCHPDEIRRLSIPEIKRLASFPDTFVLEGTYKQQWAQIGNCVPPLFMRAIAQHVRTLLMEP